MGGHYQFNKRNNIPFISINLYCDNAHNFRNNYFINGYMGLFDIYSKQGRRIIMAKKVNSMDKINDVTLHELLLMMDARLKHIEDISADNRAIIVKLVKQSNQIVEFLKQLELEVQDIDYGIEEPPPFGAKLPQDKMNELKELFDDFKSRKDELKEFEKELKKHKDKLTPGQVGES